MAELLVCADLLNKNLEVYRAVNPQASCDLVVIAKGKALRIEVKLIQERLSGNALRRLRKQYGRFDILALIDREGRICYIPYASIEGLKKIEILPQKRDQSALQSSCDFSSPSESAS